jgi:predicted lactoylglutathione lyase
MEPRISLITLGVDDIPQSRKFYEAMGFTASSASMDDVVFFKSRGTVLALYPRKLLAEDAKTPSDGTGFRAVTLAHNVREKQDVARILEKAESAGAKILKPAQDVFWGGHSGYFTDPDGHLWEVAWNPHFPLNENGEVLLPD